MGTNQTGVDKVGLYIGVYGEENQMYFDPAGKKIKGPGGGGNKSKVVSVNTPLICFDFKIRCQTSE